MRTLIKYLFNKKVRKFIWLAVIAPALLSPLAMGIRNVNTETAWVAYNAQFKQVRVERVDTRVATSVAWGNLIAERT